MEKNLARLRETVHSVFQCFEIPEEVCFDACWFRKAIDRVSHAYEGTPEPNSLWRNSSYIIVCVSVPFLFNWLQWLGFVGKWTLFTWELGPFSSFPFVRSVVVFMWIGICIIHLTKPAGKEAWKDRSLGVWGLFLLQYLSSPHDCGLKLFRNVISSPWTLICEPRCCHIRRKYTFNGGGSRCINMFKFEEQLQFRIYVISALCSVEDFQRIFCRDAFSTQFLSYVILLLCQE